MKSFDECPCSGKTLTRHVQPAVMAVLAAEPLHGYVIVQRLSGMIMFRNHHPDITGVYRLLRSLEKNGYVASTWQHGGSGPAKRRYALTADGRKCLARWITTLHAYREAVADLLDTVASSATAKSRRENSFNVSARRRGRAACDHPKP